MLSRVANSLFWLGRYIERAENYARFIDVNYNLSLDLPPEIKEQWRPLIAATGDEELYNELIGNVYSRELAIYFLAFDERNPNAIISTVKAARENARIIRETIPKESWEVLNEIHYYVQDCANNKIWENENPIQYFKHIKGKIQQFNGFGYDTVPRNQSWYFLKLGQHLERADKTSRILDVKYHILLPSEHEVGSPLDYLHWTALLKSVSGFNSYRQLYHSIAPANIVEYLILDKHFPRSVYYCLNIVEICLREISGSKRGNLNKPEKLIGSIRSKLEYDEVSNIFNVGIHEYLDELQISLNNFAEGIYEQFFKIQPNTIDFQVIEE